MEKQEWENVYAEYMYVLQLAQAWGKEEPTKREAEYFRIIMKSFKSSEIDGNVLDKADIIKTKRQQAKIKDVTDKTYRTKAKEIREIEKKISQRKKEIRLKEVWMQKGYNQFQINLRNITKIKADRDAKIELLEKLLAAQEKRDKQIKERQVLKEEAQRLDNELEELKKLSENCNIALENPNANPENKANAQKKLAELRASIEKNQTDFSNNNKELEEKSKEQLIEVPEEDIVELKTSIDRDNKICTLLIQGKTKNEALCIIGEIERPIKEEDNRESQNKENEEEIEQSVEEDNGESQNKENEEEIEEKLKSATDRMGEILAIDPKNGIENENEHAIKYQLDENQIEEFQELRKEIEKFKKILKEANKEKEETTNKKSEVEKEERKASARTSEIKQTTNKTANQYKIESIHFDINSGYKISIKDTNGKTDYKNFEIESDAKEETVIKNEKLLKDKAFDKRLYEILQILDGKLNINSLDQYKKMISEKTKENRDKSNDLSIDYDFSNMFTNKDKEMYKKYKKIAKSAKKFGIANYEKAPNILKRIINKIKSIKLLPGSNSVQGRENARTGETETIQEKLDPNQFVNDTISGGEKAEAYCDFKKALTVEVDPISLQPLEGPSTNQQEQGKEIGE